MKKKTTARPNHLRLVTPGMLPQKLTRAGKHRFQEEIVPDLLARLEAERGRRHAEVEARYHAALQLFWEVAHRPREFRQLIHNILRRTW